MKQHNAINKNAINKNAIMMPPPWVLYMPWSVSTENLRFYPWARSSLSACILAPSPELRGRFWLLLSWLAGCTPECTRHCPAWQFPGCQQSLFLSSPLPCLNMMELGPVDSWHFGPWGPALLFLSPDILCSAIIILIPIPSHLILVWGQWSVWVSKKVKVSCLLWSFVCKLNASIPLT